MKLTRPIFIFSLAASFAHPVFAYLDPGAGSFMLQMLIAGVMSVLFTLKMYWYRLKAMVYRLLGKPIDDCGKEDDEPVDDAAPSSSAAEEKNKH